MLKNRKGDSGTLGRFTEEAFYPDQNILLWMSSWIGSVTNGQRTTALRTTMVRFSLVGNVGVGYCRHDKRVVVCVDELVE
jgi:hypothetical protein